jgi:hypothetical protein
MATNTETKNSEHWAWRDPNRPRWLMIGLTSDWWGKDGHLNHPRDEADCWRWIRSATSRNLHRCASEAKAHERLALARELWQKNLDKEKRELDQAMDRWRRDLDDLANHDPNQPGKSRYRYVAPTKQAIDKRWQYHVDSTRSIIRDLEHCLSMRFVLDRVTIEATAVTTIEEVP